MSTTPAIGSLKRDQSGDEEALLELFEIWRDVWSPKDGEWDGERLRNIFAAGVGAIHVVDDFEGGTVILKSVDDYIAEWTPVMAAMRYWCIKPIEAPSVLVSGNLAVMTFSFHATAILPDGTRPENPIGQLGTHVWQCQAGGWRLVHEHLTNL